MKRYAFLNICILFSVIFGALSCSDMAIPEKVSVKTDAKYSYNAGKVNTELSEYIDLRKQLSDGLGDKATVYDYQPNNTNIQYYLINYPVMETSLDLSDYLNSSSTGFNQEGSYTLTIPTVSGTETKNITITSSDIVSKLAISDVNLTVVESGSTDPIEITSNILPTINISIEAGSASFESGMLKLTLTPPSTTSASFERTVTAKLLDSAGNVISTSGSVNAIGTNANELSLSLAGKTLSGNMKISFSGSVKGGTASQQDVFTAACTFSTDCKLSKVTGLTTTTNASSINTSITISSDPLKTATIGTGSLTVKAIMPSGCTGLSASFDSSNDLTINGALTHVSSFTNVVSSGYLLDKRLDLSGATLTPGTLSITGNVIFSLSNATLVFSNGNVGLGVNVDYEITKLTSAKVKVASVPKVSISEDLSSLGISDVVTSITNAVITLNGTYKNTFPTGNDIVLNLSSTNPGIDSLQENGNSATITATGSTDATSSSIHKTSKHTFTISSDTIDISMTAGLPSQETVGTETFATFTNIVPGSEYKLSFSFSSDIDFDSAEVSVTAIKSKLTTSQEVDLSSFDIGEIFDSVPEGITGLDGIKFDTIPVYLYAVAPTTISNEFTSNKITLAANYKDTNDTSQTTNLLNNADISFVTSLPSFADENTTYKEDLDSSNCSVKVASGFEDIINNRASNLKLAYTVTLGSSNSTVTIHSSDLESTSTVSMMAVIAIPLSVMLEDDVVYEVYNDTSDLFKRSQATESDSKISEILSAIESFTISSTVQNSTGLPLQVQITDTASGLNKTFSFTENSTLTLTNEEIQNILSAYPFAPVIKAVITKPADNSTYYRITRDAQFTSNIVFDVKTNGTISVFGEDK